MPLSDERESWRLLVQDNTAEGRVDVETGIVVLHEAKCPEFVHEKIDPRLGCANHFPPSSPAIFWGQRFLAGIEKLIDQILLDSDVP